MTGNSTLVALALFALFLVYITARGRLPNYLAVFFGKVTSDSGSGSSGAAASPASVLQPFGALGTPSGILSGGTGDAAGIYASGLQLGTTGGF